MKKKMKSGKPGIDSEASSFDDSHSNLAKDNSGVGVVELILILVILIALVLIFKNQITKIVQDAFTAITGNANEILK